jgi:hypothetical protein
MHTILIISTLLGSGALSLGLFLHFDKKFKKALKDVIASQEESFRVMDLRFQTSLSRLKFNAEANIARIEGAAFHSIAGVAAGAHEVHKTLVNDLSAGHKEVVTIKGDILSEIKTLHEKVDAVEAAALKGYDTAKDHLVEAAKSVLNSPRRVCSYCDRKVHAFEIEASGLVKCLDCKHRG